MVSDKLFNQKFFNRTKGFAIIALIILASVLLAINSYNANVKAQTQATVIISQPIGGTIDPVSGTYNYDDQTPVILTANADAEAGYTFYQWVISTDASNDTETNNPFTLTVTEGVTYNVAALFSLPAVEPIFPLNQTTHPPAQAELVILHTVGGNTDPIEGSYYTGTLNAFRLTAIADNGWTFNHWVISGSPAKGMGGSSCTGTSTANPVNVTLDLGYTYAYQPVFEPTVNNVTTTPTPTPAPGSTMGLSNETWIAIVLAVVLAIVVVAFLAYATSKKAKK
jgi:hypothetical protein